MPSALRSYMCTLQGAESLSMTGLTQHVCLPVTYCYQNGDMVCQGQATVRNKTKQNLRQKKQCHFVYKYLDQEAVIYKQ